jgi:hypothetical protein
MRDTQVWSTAALETTHVVVQKGETFYVGSVPTADHANLVRKIEDGEDPRELLGKHCPRVTLDEITRVVANNVGDLVIESADDDPLKVPLAKEGIKVLETIQDAKGPGWIADVERKTRIRAALTALAVGLLMGGGFLWLYFGARSGRFDGMRVHWLAAFLLNTFGPTSMLVLGAIIFIGAMFGFGYYLANPAEIWTLEED